MYAMNNMISSRGKLMDLSSPLVMGILNVNEDSFYKESRVLDLSSAVEKAKAMSNQGAVILDIGAMSSRPGAEISEPQDEIKKLSPVIEALVQELPNSWISIDTVHASVALAMYDLGAHIINDISAGTIDREMLKTVGKLNIPYIGMHMQGLPKNMQDNPQYKDVVSDVIQYLAHKIDEARQCGIKDIIIDPGFGFGKTVAQNFSLLNNLCDFHILDCPILSGISRKSFIYKTLNTSADKALNGTTALNMASLMKGAKILRVHDVAEAVECVSLYKALGENPDV